MKPLIFLKRSHPPVAQAGKQFQFLLPYTCGFLSRMEQPSERIFHWNDKLNSEQRSVFDSMDKLVFSENASGSSINIPLWIENIEFFLETILIKIPFLFMNL